MRTEEKACYILKEGPPPSEEVLEALEDLNIRAVGIERAGSRGLEGGFLLMEVKGEENLSRSIQEIPPTTPLLLIVKEDITYEVLRHVMWRRGEVLFTPFSKGELRFRLRNLASLIESSPPPEGSLKRREDLLLGVSPLMEEVRRKVLQVAKIDANVLVIGDSGTGKELVARMIHRYGPRGDGPFFIVNCAAIPSTLLESELFGHVKGAFTDARTDKKGLFLEANRGTLVLDEIGEMAIESQATLLRAIQFGEVRPIGGAKTFRADTRIIATTNKDLREEVKRGGFREDLFFRLNIFLIRIPPLKERREDIPLLAEHFLEIYSKKFQRAVKGFEKGIMNFLTRQEWKGNVRELENFVQRLVIYTEGETVKFETLRHLLKEEGKDIRFFDTLRGFTAQKRRAIEAFEKDYLEGLLEATRGNVSQASRIAGIDRKNLYTLFKRYGIDPKRMKKT